MDGRAMYVKPTTPGTTQGSPVPPETPLPPANELATPLSPDLVNVQTTFSGSPQVLAYRESRESFEHSPLGNASATELRPQKENPPRQVKIGGDGQVPHGNNSIVDRTEASEFPTLFAPSGAKAKAI